jgi:nucleotide-binding universal stress UspA family protein
MIVAMAILTTLAMPPMLRWGLARVPLRKEEKERIEREEFETKGFVPQLERLLLAVDDGQNARFASRLAGLLAGPRGMPITVLALELAKSKKASDARPARPKRPDLEKMGVESPASEKVETKKIGIEEGSSGQIVEATAARTRDPAENKAEVQVRVATNGSAVEDIVAAEAKKGYDLLVVGIANIAAKGGGFHKDITRIASAFEGPLAVTVGRNEHLEDPQHAPLNILVPVAGTDMSRRAAEVAIALGRACKAPVTAIYVLPKSPSGARGRRSRRQEQAILKDIVEVADRSDYEIKTAVQASVAPDKAIVTTAKRGGHDLIVMGVSRRAGEALDFGDTAAAVLENVDASILFVAT